MTDRSTTQEPPASTPSSAQPVESEVRHLYTEQRKQAGLAYPTETTMFLNFGYWPPDCSSLDEACRTLAERLGDAAGITRGDRVLDAGFGFGDQDMHWMETRGPALIAGLNVTPAQVELAQKRVRERKLDDRIDLKVGSATDMPFEAESFDRIVALESAFHFDTRQDFFGEAARVLRPGGTLATADVILLAGGDREQRIREMGDCRSLV
ncbi:cyclopropane-fatty-acyl-phospholipid synthase family protein, partial [Streptomyces sp. 2MCAF27]